MAEIRPAARHRPLRARHPQPPVRPVRVVECPLRPPELLVPAAERLERRQRIPVRAAEIPARVIATSVAIYREFRRNSPIFEVWVSPPST